MYGYLNALYQDASRLFTLSTKHPITETYGEILFPSITKIINKINIGPSDVFLDFGSGLGKVVVQFFLQTEIKSAYGIEINPTLHHTATQILNRMKQEQPHCFQNYRTLTFIRGNFLKTKLPQATIVLLGSPCFSQPMLNEIGKMLNQMESAHTVLSLRPIPSLQRLPFKTAFRVECSWDSALCYLYIT